MRHPRGFLRTTLVFLSLIGTALADNPTRPKASWEGQDARVVLFSPDGQSLVSSGRDGFRLRDARTGQVRAVLTAPPAIPLLKPVFTPDSRMLFAQVMSDRSLPLVVHDVMAWDVASGQLRGTFPYVGEHLDEGSFELSGDGRILAFVDNSERLPVQVKTTAAVLDGRHKLNISSNVNPNLPRVKVWNVPGWKELAVVNGGLPLALSRDGNTLATGDRNWRTPIARIWDTATGQLLAELEDRTPGVWPFTLSPDGKILASCSHSNSALWTLADSRKWPIDIKGAGAERPKFSPDRRLIFPNGLPRRERNISYRARPCYDVSVMPPRLLDLGNHVVVSPNASRYLTTENTVTSNGRTVNLHGLNDQHQIRHFDVPGLIDARFSPDGHRLALLVAREEMDPGRRILGFARTLRVVDTDSGREAAMIPIPAPVWPEPDWTFSPDGKMMAVWYNRGTNVVLNDDSPSDRPQTVELWDIPPH
jgi:WD40 repeat protein